MNLHAIPWLDQILPQLALELEWLLRPWYSYLYQLLEVGNPWKEMWCWAKQFPLAHDSPQGGLIDEGHLLATLATAEAVNPSFLGGWGICVALKVSTSICQSQPPYFNHFLFPSSHKKKKKMDLKYSKNELQSLHGKAGKFAAQYGISSNVADILQNMKYE